MIETPTWWHIPRAMRRSLSLLSLSAFLTGLCFSVVACDEEEETESVDGVRAGEPCDTFGEESVCRSGGVMLCGIENNVGQVWTECVTADYECVPGDTMSCGFSDPGFENWTQNCVLYDGQPAWNVDSCETPLVLSFDGGAVEMRASSAAFDISGAGMCLDTDWPAATNPWLAIDLDGNGYIDGGFELFGSGTITAGGGHAKNGFVALAELDDNGDGKVDPADARFDEILVWRDEDGDKQSVPWELQTLAQEGVTSIELEHEVRVECDDRGNCGRERSRFEFVGGSGELRVGEVVDVYPACR